MKAAIFSGNSKSSQWTATAMEKYFDEVDHLYLRYIDITFGGKEPIILYKGKPLKEYDCLYIKGSFRYAPLLQSLAQLHYNKEGVYLPYRPDAYLNAHDKLITQLMLQQHSIPMPKTYLSATIDAARQILARLSFPVIMKFPQGTQGKGVMFADSFASATSILDALHALNQPFLIQEYIESDASDIRLFVIGDEVVAAMKRKASGDDKRANLHAGGTSESFLPDPYMKKIAVQSAKAIGAEICGVDILESSKGPLVIEVNSSPGLQGITEITKIDIADKIAKHLYENTKRKATVHRNKKTKEIMTELNVQPSSEKEMMLSLDFRGNRIMLPQIITQLTKFNQSQTVKMQATKNKLVIEKFM